MAVAIALGPRPTEATRGPPCDGETVEVARRLLAHDRRLEADAEALIGRVKKATLKVRRN